MSIEMAIKEDFSDTRHNGIKPESFFTLELIINHRFRVNCVLLHR